MTDFLAALSLVAVLEGLALFVVPDKWKRTILQLVAMDDKQLRKFGAAAVAAGLVALYLVRG